MTVLLGSRVIGVVDQIGEINLRYCQEVFALQERDFSHHFEIIYDKFTSLQEDLGKVASVRGLGLFLGHGHDGKAKAWKKGQWPSAEDCARIEKLLGFDLRWLVIGEGEPFGGTPPPAEAAKPEPAPPPVAVQPDQSDEIARLRAELDEVNRLNRKLVTRLLIDGAGDKNGSTSTVGKTADGQR